MTNEQIRVTAEEIARYVYEWAEQNDCLDDADVRPIQEIISRHLSASVPEQSQIGITFGDYERLVLREYIERLERHVTLAAAFVPDHNNALKQTYDEKRVLEKLAAPEQSPRVCSVCGHCNLNENGRCQEPMPEPQVVCGHRCELFPASVADGGVEAMRERIIKAIEDSQSAYGGSKNIDYDYGLSDGMDRAITAVRALTPGNRGL